MKTHQPSILRTALVVLGMLTATPGFAAEPQDAMDTIVVTGTRLDNSIASTPSHVTLIDRQTIEQRRDASVLDLLRSTAGVHVAQLGGRGGASSVFLRGSEPNFTVVLIDGIKVNDPNNTRGGSFDFSTLSLSQIERIEIIRGAQSSIYGSDGLSGVISITTRNPQAAGAIVSLEAGQDSLARGGLNLAVGMGDSTRLSVGVSAEDDGEPVEGSTFESRSGNIALTSDVSNDLFIAVKALYNDAESTAFPEDSGGPRLAVLRAVDTRDQQQQTLTGTVRYRFSDRTRLNILAGYARHEETTASPGIAPGLRAPVPPSTSDAVLKRANFTMNGVFDLGSSTRATIGFDHQDEDGQLVGSVELFPGFSLPQDFTLDRRIRGFFGELSFEANDSFNLNVSVRNDKPDNYGSETTARVGAQFNFADARLFASWGEAFKLPSFFALGHALVGNPSLRPERSTNWELGIGHQTTDAISLTLTAFDNEFEDLIDFDGATFQMVNLNRVETSGVELATEYRASERFALTAHATYVDIDVIGPGELLQRPDWRAGIGFQWQPSDALNLNVDWLHVGDAPDSSVPTDSVTLNSYNRLDVVLSFAPSEAMSLFIAIDNAMNNDFESAVGFPAPGQRVRAGVRYAIGF